MVHARIGRLRARLVLMTMMGTAGLINAPAGVVAVAESLEGRLNDLLAGIEPVDLVSVHPFPPVGVLVVYVERREMQA